MKISRVLVLAVACAAAACSSSTEKTPDTGNGSSGSSQMPSPTPTDPPADTTSPAATVKAPTIDKVAKMLGALHVMWTNAEAACDAIELERQAQMEDGTVHEKYKVVFTLPGDADNKHDASATDAMKYTYRLRCKKGAAYSPYSNEMSGSPK